MRPAIERLQGSLIREIANAGMGRADIVWLCSIVMDVP